MPERDDFYVGYMAMPRSHRRFLRLALPLTLFVMLASGAAIALTQRDPGDATWQTGEPSSWSGTITMEPYPVLHVAAGEDAGSYLLVRMGKLGAADIAQQWADAPLLTVRGRLLERDGRRMIELDDAPGADPPVAAIDSNPPKSAPSTTPTVLGVIDTRGEILDAKCYLGAMKPGDGKAHKACAILCLEGGIPPMLVSRAADGSPRYHLLLERNGDPLDPARFALAGEPVRVTGIAEARGDLTYLRLATLERAPTRDD